MHLQVRPTILFITPTGLSMIVPRLELQTLVQRPDLDIQPFAWGDSEGFVGAFRAAVDMLHLHGKTLGIDGMTMRATEMIRIESVTRDLRIVPIERELIRIRSIKGADEVASMRRAVQIAESALGDLMGEVEPGMSELQIGARLSVLMTQHGGEGDSFAPAVQTGPNSANPHAPAGDRKLQKDEFLLIDFGCRVNGYPSDITRTFCLGTPTAEMQRIYDTVLRANEAAQKAAKPGVAMGVVDAAARAVIARVQSDNVCFVGGASWRGRWVMRAPIIAAPLAEADIDRLAEAVIGAWRAVQKEPLSRRPSLPCG